MIKRPFFGFGKPKLKYPLLEDVPQDAIIELPVPPKVTLLLKRPPLRTDDLILKTGDEVRTGQKLRLVDGSEDYLVSSVTGTIDGISEYIGYLGQRYTSISIDAAKEDEWDHEFSEVGNTPNPETACGFLESLPGGSDFATLLNFQAPVNTVIVYGIDKDLLVTTNQLTVRTGIEALVKGAGYLKEITHAGRMMIVVPPHLTSLAEKSGLQVKAVRPTYPNALPEIVMKDILGEVVQPGKSPEEAGVGFISAEAVAALAAAFTDGKIPVNKIVTVVKKDHSVVNVRTRIGTHVGGILDALHIETEHGDRLVLGGPMMGNTIYSGDIPISSDTDAVMIQGKDQVISNSDTPCINCGECVRACPADIPINMLVRLLENGLFEEAARDYDLLSCIECGLCSYVCTARIPVFHYIMLGKYEFARSESAEDSNV
ncbi:MAG: 4Fe-4S dicluster domain-containing protein [Thermodesulfobacteriota bacterium]|nr:4Fe-4S dicluster domain-containing protein [Thermodesulfobacteriota bacterium]